mmetsp:Transcript_10322/g.8876  ORF Transcript_10322/g.8876 Transcript_10322/m.8876 type:complete len:203 (-) Transcript_10322:8-616(-)
MLLQSLPKAFLPLIKIIFQTTIVITFAIVENSFGTKSLKVSVHELSLGIVKLILFISQAKSREFHTLEGVSSSAFVSHPLSHGLTVVWWVTFTMGSHSKQDNFLLCEFFRVEIDCIEDLGLKSFLFSLFAQALCKVSGSTSLRSKHYSNGTVILFWLLWFLFLFLLWGFLSSLAFKDKGDYQDDNAKTKESVSNIFFHALFY